MSNPVSLHTAGFTCPLPITLQGAELDVLTDAECSAIWDSNYNGDVHVCVYDNENQLLGACNVS